MQIESEVITTPTRGMQRWWSHLQRHDWTTAARQRGTDGDVIAYL